MNQIPMWTRKKNSLEDVRSVLNAMGAPDRDIPAIHVAGTNGKGSVCAFLTSMLREAGYRTGTFISPHLVEVRERFLINGAMVGEQDFEEAFETVLRVSQRMVETGKCHPTFFEFLFYMAMELFKKQEVDVMVLETGMGGRLDTTNVLEHPCACVITSISLDHTKYLGDTLQKIAAEKAGIIKSSVPLIFDDNQPQVSTILEGCAFRRGAARYPVGREDYRVEGVGEDGLTVSRVLGHKPEGAAGAITWNITDEQIVRGIKKTMWPGRMEQAAPGVYLDGAHNPGGIGAFIQTAREIAKRLGKHPYLLFAAVSDKDYGEMVSQLSKGIAWETIGVVHMNSDRGLSSEALAREFEKDTDCPVLSFEDTGTAVRRMREISGEGVLFCAGSLYLIGEIKAALERLKQKEA